MIFGAKNVLPLQPQSLTARDKKATSFLVAKSHRKKTISSDYKGLFR